MRICTYFTEGFYEEVADNHIISSAKNVGVDLYKVKVPSLHNWKANTSMKAQVIFSLLETLNEDIVMVDADATFEQYPKLFEEIPQEYDMAVHYLDTEKFWKRKLGNSKKQLCSGTIMFRNSLKNKQLLITWIEENKKNPNILEQKNLENILKNYDIKIYDLPINYCAIINHEGFVPLYITDIVIKHHQISRKSKGRC